MAVFKVQTLRVKDFTMQPQTAEYKGVEITFCDDIHGIHLAFLGDKLIAKAVPIVDFKKDVIKYIKENAENRQ